LQLVDTGAYEIVLAAQVLHRVACAVEQGRHVLQGEAELAVGQYGVQPVEITFAVEPIAGRRPIARAHQTDRVVVMQSAHRHAGQARHLADRHRLGRGTGRLPVPAVDHFRLPSA
jgi:hypothetical protein